MAQQVVREDSTYRRAIRGIAHAVGLRVMASLQFSASSLTSAVRGDLYWEQLANTLDSDSSRAGIHVSVMLEPYLTLVLQGLKTIESRFSTTRQPPYGRVRPGDVLLLKRSGGPIVGICEVDEAWYYHLDPRSWRDIRKEFEIGLRIQDPNFWYDRKDAEYATLLRVKNARSINPITILKRDRRGWIVLRQPREHHRIDDIF